MVKYMQLLGMIGMIGMIGMMGTIRHDIMPSGFCMWHDGGMTGSMTVRLSCHSQADT